MTVATDEVRVALEINGVRHEVTVPARTTLADLLRDHLHLTGTHLGCEHGVCGACTVLADGAPIRSCTTLAAACTGVAVTTVEGLAGPLAETVRQAFRVEHGLQCGFCTPGMVVTACDIVARGVATSADQVRDELSGNLCRCTGYVGIVRAVLRAAEQVADARPDDRVPTPEVAT